MACTKQPNCRCQVCENITARRVVLAYVPGEPTKLALFNTIDSSEIDLLPIIQAGETDTKLELIIDEKMLRYYPERWLSSGGTKGCVHNICLEDIFALMTLGDLGDVDAAGATTGMTIRYNIETGKWELFNLDLALQNLQNQITNQTGDITNLLATLQNLTARLTAIEDAIYNWTNDKSTKIARGNINIRKGGRTSSQAIMSIDPGQSTEVNFS